MKFIIRQEAGIGDIFFLQKIAKKLVNRGDEVVWPIKESIYDLITKHLPASGIKYIKYRDLFSTEGYQILDFHNTSYYYPEWPLMVSKYKYYGEEWNDWLNWFEFTRDTENEDNLFYNILGLKDDEEFILVHKTYSTQPSVQNCTHMEQLEFPGKKVIETSFIEGTNLFSWCKVLEKAKEIHSVDTSLMYIIEKLKTTDTLHMYSKWTPPTFCAIRWIFNKPWNYHFANRVSKSPDAI